MTRHELKLLVKLDEMVVKSYKHGTGKDLTTANKVVEWNQNVSDLPRPVQSLTNSRRLATGPLRGPTPRMSAAAARMEMEVLCSLRNVVDAQQMVQPDGWSSRSSSARVRRKQRSAPPTASGRGESGRSALLIGRLSIPVLTRLVFNLA